MLFSSIIIYNTVQCRILLAILVSDWSDSEFIFTAYYMYYYRDTQVTNKSYKYIQYYPSSFIYN